MSHNSIDRPPLVSIITPAYNRASYLDETIQSVLGQDYEHIEYIVLDDGSTDNTVGVLQKYTGRILWETHSNRGETFTVNKGLSMARGEIIAVVNSDDPLLPDAVGTAVDFMQAHPDILVGYPDWDYIGPRSEFIGHVRVPECDYLHMVKQHHCIVGPGAFIRRRAFELAGMRDPEFRYVADFDLWLRLGLYGKFARIPKTLATFRTHPGSATASRRGQAMAEEQVRVYDKFYARTDIPPEVRRVRAEAYSWAYAAAAWWSRPLSVTSLRYLLKSIVTHPPSALSKWKMAVPAVVPVPLYRLLAWSWYRVRRFRQDNTPFRG